MAEDSKHIKTISKLNAGFPDYLDFDKLRTEGIGYLGKLSGKIWTDHNVHDPGITILEVLCYALLDLGYRTNLPAEDIFTRKSEDKSKDDNFFTPAQILACNPLTITDYRKLLIDIEGVKNAWLEVATKEVDKCRQTPVKEKKQQKNSANSTNEVDENQTSCKTFLNGLYHVYIELENEEADRDRVLCKVKKALMAHRNLCEDFVDVHILCKLEIGVCADIELEENANIEEVYISIAEKLRSFFSPSPQFYTLQQLLDKNKPIEEIFAGRPYNITESHGFVDTDELQDLKLRKEIHLSDVYNAIFEIEGVRKIKNLILRNCESKQLDKNWKYALPQNHIPDFSVECSGFQFSKNGLNLPFDIQKYKTLFDLNFTQNGKILYQSPAPNLHSEIPNGIYRKDLSDYTLLENDFPRVYGIAEGGLSDSASSERKAQAMQLKGYLLFFDQLLSNYLAQLTNVRALFSMSATSDKSKQHTYFLNQLKASNDLQKLIKFPISESFTNELGSEGTILLYPLEKSILDAIIATNTQIAFRPETITLFSFTTFGDERIAINQLQNDLISGNITDGFLNENTSNIYYYIKSPGNDFALISNKSFATIEAAKQHLNTVEYIATIDSNYRSFITSNNEISFNIELSIASYTDYLQLIIEDKGLYIERRNAFLDHLLSRFAERFTDFALLSYGTYASEQDLALATIQVKEHFLHNYDNISSNRGKAYDYFQNDWNNDNISGFEQEVKFLAGIENKQLHSLCNFVVEQYDDQFVVIIKLLKQGLFALNEKFDSKADALEAAQEAFMALSDRSNLSQKYFGHSKLYGIQLQHKGKNYELSTLKYPNAYEADELIDNFCRMFEEKPRIDDVWISKYRYELTLLNNQNVLLLTSKQDFFTNEDALNDQINLASLFNQQKEPKRKLVLTKKNSGLLKFVNIEGFKIDINDTIVGKPGRFTYDWLDKNNSFKFYPNQDFTKNSDAKNHCHEVIKLATEFDNYHIVKNTENNKFAIVIMQNGEAEAISYSEFSTEKKAFQMCQQIHELVLLQVYHTEIKELPFRWKFNHYLGYNLSEIHSFTSQNEFDSFDKAFRGAVSFREKTTSLKLDSKAENHALKANFPPTLLLNKNQDSASVEQAIIQESLRESLERQQFVTRLLSSPSTESFTDFVQPDELSQQGKHVYRLVDKDNPLAYYVESFSEKEDSKRKVAKQLREAINYLEICLGGDIIVAVEDPKTKQKSYHYQIKSRNDFYSSGEHKGENLVFFESKKGYDSRELAEEAFTKNYLLLLNLAKNTANYDQKWQLLLNSEAISLVPVETQKVRTIDEIIELINQYPIQIIEKDFREFDTLFCKKSTQKTPKNACKKESEKQYVYYFTLNKWQSIKYYETVAEAQKDFLFFLTLLKFSGNLYADCYDCEQNNGTSYRIYIREILVESTRRFKSEKEAWMKEGIEKFICAVQAKNAFHNLQKKDCNHAFYLNCGPDLAVHPCKYDTARQRNEAMYELHKLFIQHKLHEEIIPIKNDKKEIIKFCFEIKLTDETPKSYQESCGMVEVEDEQNCEVGWRSACCYTNEKDAQEGLNKVLKLLSKYENYQATFDCECNSFGINLLSGNTITFNPQSYATTNAVYEAVERTKKLTNAEGLHVVEHILLRPNVEADCECRGNLTCENTHCSFTWKVSDEDPCSDEQDICFVPGADPYSFIATVVLPAWSARFRSLESRKLMENILYRNAPAHVMLRILWLAPHDFCCFEQKYKNWHKHLAKKQICKDNFSECDFLEFLFHRQFECLKPCEECQPCINDKPTDQKSCFEDKPEGSKLTFIEQVNERFCWKLIDCGENKYEFIPCETPQREQVQIAIKEDFSKKSLLQFLNKRVANYKKTVDEIKQNLDSSVVEKVQIFLKTNKVSLAKIQENVGNVLKNKQNEGENAIIFNKNQVADLLQSIIAYSLDKWAFDENEIKNIESLKDLFQEIRAANVVEMKTIYDFWIGTEVKKYAPKLDIEQIKSLLIGGQ